jgi:glycosyltransferase involved in cell wall biosynthesis
LLSVLRQPEIATPGADLFIGHDMHGLLPAWLLSRRYHRPLIYHCHDFTDDNISITVGARIVHWFERRLARTADLVIVPDASRAQFIRHALRLTRPPLVVGNAPLAVPPPDQGRLMTLLQAQGLAFSKVLFRQGRIGAGHGLEVTLRSMSQWADPTWGFVVMGFSEPDYLQHIHTLAESLGVAHQFVTLPPVMYDEVSKFTVGATAGHAVYEPIHINNRFIATASNKILEYMAAGLPLLTSDQPDIRILVARFACGILVDPTSPTAIAHGVNQLLGDSHTAHQLGQAGRQAFSTELNYSTQFAPVVQWIAEVVR